MGLERNLKFRSVLCEHTLWTHTVNPRCLQQLEFEISDRWLCSKSYNYLKFKVSSGPPNLQVPCCLWCLFYALIQSLWLVDEPYPTISTPGLPSMSRVLSRPLSQSLNRSLSQSLCRSSSQSLNQPPSQSLNRFACRRLSTAKSSGVFDAWKLFCSKVSTIKIVISKVNLLEHPPAVSRT